MSIIDITLRHQKIALKTPFVTALRRVDAVEFVQVAVITENGLIGIGEAPPTKVITGEDIGTIIKTIEQQIKPLFLQKQLQTIDDAIDLLHGCCEGNSSAKAAVDMALYDLFSKAVNKPLYAYLGGSRQTLKTDVTISLNTPEKMAADAGLAIENGFTILKIKVGGKDDLDIDRIKAVREQTGKKATLLVDANQAWKEDEAMRIIEALSTLDIRLIEQPVPAHALKSLKRITEKSTIAILADESAFTLEDARKIIDEKAADMINIKLMKCGGISKAIEIIELCEANSIKCMMGSMLEGPTSIAAAAHLATAYPETITLLDLDSPLLYQTLPENSPVTFTKNDLTLIHKSGI